MMTNETIDKTTEAMAELLYAKGTAGLVEAIKRAANIADRKADGDENPASHLRWSRWAGKVEEFCRGII